MGQIRTVDPSLVVVAIFSRHANALAWAEHQLERCLGPIALRSEDFTFNQTRYYNAEMGEGLRKRFLAFERLSVSDALPGLKLWTNQLEAEASQQLIVSEVRPINIDPGLLQLGKFLLATTKDQAHRIYLRDGIYAEVTLRFQDGAFEPWPWTYADYREAGAREFLKKARDFFRIQLGRRQGGELSSPD